MTDIKKILEEIAVDDKSGWLEKARYRRENRRLLRKSQEIAIRVLSVLDEKGMQQKELAEAMDVSPQQVSKIVKGKENMTLQTIAKLEQVLEISLFEVPRHSPLSQKSELLPEGVNLEGLLRGQKIDRSDAFSQLMAVGGDMVGAVTVHKVH